MVNLLPPATKQTIIYARRNRILRRWAITLVVAICGLAILVIFGQLYVNRSVQSYTVQVEQARQELTAQKPEETQKRVEDISSSLKLVLQVLSREVLFSKLIRQVGAAMPGDTVLTGLEISTVQGGIDLSASSIDYNTATQIQVNLQDPKNQIFEQADIISITCVNASDPATVPPGTTAIPDEYPCQVQIRALFAKDNPFLFINNTASPAGQNL